MVAGARLLIDRRGVCRRFDVSIPVLRRGGFQWTMERREHRQENCCLPPGSGGKNSTAQRLHSIDIGLGVDFHFDLLNTGPCVERGSLEPSRSCCAPKHSWSARHIPCVHRPAVVTEIPISAWVSVRREKVQFFSRCNSYPAQVAPAGSYRSGGGGNETVEAFETTRRLAVWRVSRP